MIRALIFTVGALVGAAIGSVPPTLRALEVEGKLAEARGDAAEANEQRQQLLSGGRFVRTYDPKTGASVYTFKASAKAKR